MVTLQRVIEIAALKLNAPAQFECDLPAAQRDDVACRLCIVARFTRPLE